MTDSEMPPAQVERLITLNRALVHQHLLRGLAHDIRNNLQVVALGASLGEESASSAIINRVERSLDDIVGALDLLSWLGRSPADDAADADLGDAVAESIRLAELQRSLPTLRVALEGPVAQATVALGRADLVLILLNLLANAKAASGHAAAPVTISTSLPLDGRVTIDVVDTGPGIPPSAGAAFVTTGDPALHGGLGLFVSRVLVERSGGRLSWEREPGGTRVRVELPAIGRD